MSWKLKRTTQCAKCPWRTDVDPTEIPDGYTEEKHRNLKCTIAQPGAINLGPQTVMACHESGKDGSDQHHCIGWLANQLGPGNNIGMRLRMMDCENGREVRTIGEQHATFADTLPG